MPASDAHDNLTFVSPTASEEETWALPLPVGLRAAAADVSSGGLRRALIHLADRLERFQPLDAALAEVGPSLPPFLQELLQGSVRSDNPGRIFGRYVQQSRRSHQVHRALQRSFTVPIVVSAASTFVLLFVLIVLVPQFKKIFEDFGTAIPQITRGMFFLSDTLRSFWPIGAAIMAVDLIAILLLVVGPNVSPLRGLISRVPIVGTALRRGDWSDFCEYLALLIECRTPLPEAVELAALGTESGILIRSGRRMKAALARGESPVEAAQLAGGFPPILQNAFRHATDPRTFCAVLEGQRDIFASDGQTRLSFVPLVIGPVIFVSVSVIISFLVLSLFMPLIKLLNDLS